MPIQPCGFVLTAPNLALLLALFPLLLLLPLSLVSLGAAAAAEFSLAARVAVFSAAEPP